MRFGFDYVHAKGVGTTGAIHTQKEVTLEETKWTTGSK
jgi:hypothetical protein